MEEKKVFAYWASLSEWSLSLESVYIHQIKRAHFCCLLLIFHLQKKCQYSNCIRLSVVLNTYIIVNTLDTLADTYPQVFCTKSISEYVSPYLSMLEIMIAKSIRICKLYICKASLVKETFQI